MEMRGRPVEVFQFIFFGPVDFNYLHSLNFFDPYSYDKQFVFFLLYCEIERGFAVLLACVDDSDGSGGAFRGADSDLNVFPGFSLE